MTRFSIVIPTRNRAHLLALALESALTQTYGDYEIVVSDNASTDQTATVARGTGSGRVRYVRTERPLAMPDSWEFALSHARGEYVTYLCDDDAIAPGTLRTVERVLGARDSKVVMWGGATYYDASWPEPGLRNTMEVPTFTGRVVRMDSASKLKEIYGLRSARTPMLVNSVCHASLIEEVKRTAGRFFVGYSPDFAAGVAMLAHARSFIFVDTILSVGGATQMSTGMMVRQTRGEVFERTMQDLGAFANLRRVPLQIQVQTAQLADHFLLLKETFPEALRPYDIDWVQFFVNCRQELDIYARNGCDVSADRLAWREALGARPASLRAAVERRLARAADARTSRKQAIALAPLGIDDIVDCARYLEMSRPTLKGVVKGTLLSVFGGRRGTQLARWLGSLADRIR